MSEAADSAFAFTALVRNPLGPGLALVVRIVAATGIDHSGPGGLAGSIALHCEILWINVLEDSRGSVGGGVEGCGIIAPLPHGVSPIVVNNAPDGLPCGDRERIWIRHNGLGQFRLDGIDLFASCHIELLPAPTLRTPFKVSC